MRFNKPLLVIISLSTMVLIVIFPHICIDSAAYALALWFRTVIPSLLPFFIGAGILSQTGVVRLIGALFQPVTRFLFRLPGESAYVFIASAISGYPMGARICAELYQQNKMDRETAQRTVCFTSIGGPLFILGTVAYSLLNFPPAGTYVLAGHYLGAIAAGMLISLFYRRKKTAQPRYKEAIKDALRTFAKEQQKSLGEILEYSVMGSVQTILLIGGMMVLFNVIIGFLQHTGVLSTLSSFLNMLSLSPEITKPVLTGMVEMTAGCQAAAQTAAGMGIKIPVIALIVSFGGFSVHAQTFSIAARSGLKLRFFLLSKLVQAFSSFVFSFLLLSLFPLTQAVFQTETGAVFAAPTAIYAGSLFAFFSMAVLFATALMKKKSS